MPKKKSKIKSCIILNPPATPKEQKAFQQRSAKALALALYRSLSPEQFDALIRALEADLGREKQERRDAS